MSNAEVFWVSLGLVLWWMMHIWAYYRHQAQDERQWVPMVVFSMLLIDLVAILTFTGAVIIPTFNNYLNSL